MSNYQQTTFFTPKDTLPTTSPLKTIFGAAYDVEFGNIATAINSKLDQSSGTVNLTLPLGAAATPSLNFLGVTTTGLYATTTPSVGVAISGTSVATVNSTTLALTVGQTITPTSINGFSGALTLTNANTGTGAGVLLQLNAGTSPSTLQIIQTQSGYTGTPVTNGLTGGVQSVISGPGQVSLGCGNGAFMNVSSAGNIIITTPSSGVALTINGANGASSFIANTATGVNNSVTCSTAGGTSYAAVSSIVTTISQLTVICNNSGTTVVGVPTGSVGLGSPSAVPLVIAVNNVARLTFGSTASTATSYNFAGSLLTTSATAGTNGALPSQVAGYWNVNINGASSKIPYYAP